MKKWLILMGYGIAAIICLWCLYHFYLKSNNPNKFSFWPNHFWHYYSRELNEFEPALDIIIANRRQLEGFTDPNTTLVVRDSVIYQFNSIARVSNDQQAIIFEGQMILTDPELKKANGLISAPLDEYRGLDISGIVFISEITLITGSEQTNRTFNNDLKDESSITVMSEPVPQNCTDKLPWQIKYEAHNLPLPVLKVDACKMLVTFQLPMPMAMKMLKEDGMQYLKLDMQKRFSKPSPVLGFKVLHWAINAFNLMHQEKSVNWDKELTNYHVSDKDGQYFKMISSKVYRAWCYYTAYLILNLMGIVFFLRMSWQQLKHVRVELKIEKLQKRKQFCLKEMQRLEAEKLQLIQLEKQKAKEAKILEEEDRLKAAKVQKELELKMALNNLLNLDINMLMANIAIPGDLRNRIKIAWLDIKQINPESDWLNNELEMDKVNLLQALLNEAEKAIDLFNQMKKSIQDKILKIQALGEKNLGVKLKLNEFGPQLKEIRQKVSQAALKPKEIRQLDYNLQKIIKSIGIEV